MQFDGFIYYLIFWLAPYLRAIWKMWSKKCIVCSDQKILRRTVSQFWKTTICLAYFFSECLYVLTMSSVHLILGLGILFVFLVLSFGHFFKSWYYYFGKLLFLFYPHSVRSCLLEASVQSVLNHYLFSCFR